MSEVWYEIVIPFGSSKAAAEMCINQITKKVGPLEMRIREHNPDAHPE